jgi:hypothetical protein
MYDWPRERNLIVARHLGPKFYSRLRAEFRNIWITPIEPVLSAFCTYFRRGGNPFFHEGQVKRAWQIKPVLEQILKDGNENIGPVCVFFVETPHALRRDLGKSIWKKLASNPKSLNLIIVRHLMDIRRDDKRVLRLSRNDFEKVKQTLAFMLNLKNTMIRQYATYDYTGLTFSAYPDSINNEEDKPIIAWVNKHAKVSVRRDVERHIHLYRDTRRLCKTMGEVFRERSPKKMQTQHDKLSYQLRLLKRDELKGTMPLANRRMAWLKEFSEVTTNATVRTGSTITTTLITSIERLLQESEDMQHCVVDYQDEICDQHYMVFSLDNGELRATLGLYWDGKRYVHDQLYGIRNEDIVDKSFIKLAQAIVVVVNQRLKELDEQAA